MPRRSTRCVFQPTDNLLYMLTSQTLAQAFAPSIGFASNLTHTVIKEHDDETRSTDSALSVDTQEDMDDDELALLGPPWAKEGILSRKLYWESDGKRARKSDWKQVFVVVQKGELSMFTFGGGAKGSSMGGSLGGGNWTVSADEHQLDLRGADEVDQRQHGRLVFIDALEISRPAKTRVQCVPTLLLLSDPAHGRGVDLSSWHGRPCRGMGSDV